MTTNLKAIVVDDHDMFREAVKEFLKTLEVDVVGEAKSGHMAIKLFKRLQADLVLMDVNLPDLDGIALCERMKKLDPQVRIILYTMTEIKSAKIKNLIKADGCLLKDKVFDELPKLIMKFSQLNR